MILRSRARNERSAERQPAEKKDKPKPKDTVKSAEKDLLNVVCVGALLLAAPPTIAQEAEEAPPLPQVLITGVDIFDGKFQEAIGKLREVQKLKPANIVAANNIATCQVFCNQTGRAIEILTDLIKSDRKANINEQVISNMMSFYEVYYPATVADHKNTLVDICSKSSKDAVNAAIYIQNIKE